MRNEWLATPHQVLTLDCIVDMREEWAILSCFSHFWELKTWLVHGHDHDIFRHTMHMFVWKYSLEELCSFVYIYYRI